MATQYQWIKRGNNGGGRCNNGEIDPFNLSHVAAMGDIWGCHTTYNNGDEWFCRQLGTHVQANGVSNYVIGRASMFSRRPATSGMLYVGMGSLKLAAGSGHFAVVPDQSFSQIKVSSDGFGTNYTGTPASNYPRAVGNAIILYYDNGNDIEYAFTYNVAGLKVYQNGGGANILAPQTGVVLVSPATINGPRYKTGCLINSQHMLLGSYSWDLSNTYVGGNLYLISTSSTNLGVANSGTITVTDKTSSLPGTTKTVNWLEAANSTIYGATDSGVYEVTGNGSTWTSLGFPTNGGNPSCVRYSTVTGNLYVFCGTDPSTNHRVIAKGVGSGTSWVWTWLVTGSNLSGTEFGSGNTWYLAGAFPDMNSNGFGCLAGGVANISGTDYLYAFGTGGMNSSRDGGATWHPCSVGAGGAVDLGLAAGAGGSVLISDMDFGPVQTTNHFQTASKGGAGSAQTGLTRTKNGHTFSIDVSTAPAKATLDGVDISTDYFRSACTNPNTADLSSESPPYLYIGMYGGGALTGIPITAPVKPNPGTPSLSSDTPVQGTSITAQPNTSTWGGSPTPTFAYSWYSAPNALSSFAPLGITTQAYTPLLADVGNVLKCLVTATNSAGSANAFTEISNPVAPLGGGGDSTAPTAPGTPVLSVQSSSAIAMTWSASTDVDGFGAGQGGYRILRNSVVAATVNALTTSFTDTGLVAQTTYTYSIVAFDASNNTSTSGSASAMTLPIQPGGDQTVTIQSPNQNAVFTSQTVTVKAVVVPGTFPISKVTAQVNGGIEISMSKDATVIDGWTRSVALASGPDVIKVNAYDTTNAIVSATVNVSFSTSNTPPAINILVPAPDGVVIADNFVVVQADVEDDDGIDPTSVQISLDGVTWYTMNPPQPLTPGS